MNAWPVGDRLWVEEIAPENQVEARAKAAGLTLVTLEVNQPKATTGKVVALGLDPLLRDQVQVGDTVFFSQHAGSYVNVEGRTFRALELREITAVSRPTPQGTIQ